MADINALKKKYSSPDIDIAETKDDERHDGNKYSLPYGLCKGVGIDTTGMSPREAWEAYENKTGISKKEAEEKHWDKGERKEEESKSKSTEKESGIKSLSEIKKENEAFSRLIDQAKSSGIEYKKPQESAYTEGMQENVINEIAGGDLTRGSCVSVALAYVMNKAGYYTTDYRGGLSQRLFSSNWLSIRETFGIKTFEDLNGAEAVKQALATTEVGKEYMFCCGQHCSIIRKTEKGYEYLELQSASENGYKPLDMKTLRERFKFHRTSSVYGFKLPVRAYIISLEEMKKRKSELYYLSGYLNTNGENQQKGEAGNEK